MLRDGWLLDLQTLNYANALALQRSIWHQRVARKIPDTLILVEHPPVITVGRHGLISNLLVSEDVLRSRGIELFRVERGGDLTFHNPGQLVGYPVFYLTAALAGVRSFVHQLEASLIATLRTWGIAAHTRPNLTGVWVGRAKIAAIGIAIQRRVTFHGFALNVNNDLAGFQLINPCGIQDCPVTSMAQLLGRSVPMSCVRYQVSMSVQETFGIRLRPVSLQRLYSEPPESDISEYTP